MTDNFNQYPLSQEILEALEGLGYKTPTGIQQEVITPMLAGKNVVVKAPTGSGKTAAFAIPICEGVWWEENAPQALVLEDVYKRQMERRSLIFSFFIVSVRNFFR